MQLSGREAVAALDMLLAMYQMYLKLVAVRERPAERVPNINFGFGNVPEFCGTDYRFRTREHLRELFNRLQVPDVFRMSNGKKVRGVHVFLFFIRRLSVGSRLHDLTAEFGLEKTSLSRCFNKFARYSH
jgi:hypothetical protein